MFQYRSTRLGQSVKMISYGSHVSLAYYSLSVTVNLLIQDVYNAIKDIKTYQLLKSRDIAQNSQKYGRGDLLIRIQNMEISDRVYSTTKI